MKQVAASGADGSRGRGGPAALTFPFPQPPGPGEVREVAKGLLWARIPLPFRLDHVNVYLVADDGGWTIVDTGVSHDLARAAWLALLEGPLRGERFTRLIATHAHPDHIGLAGWLCERLRVPLLASRTCYLDATRMALNPALYESQSHRDFYRRHGMGPEGVAHVARRGYAYVKLVTPLPTTYDRLAARDVLTIGDRRFEVLSGDGHAAEQIMLHSSTERILLAADQVLARISPNIGVWATEPQGDPLGLYLRSLTALERDLPPDTLVLAGHQLPFIGLHRRCRELADAHEARCRLIVESCQGAPRTVAELVPILFGDGLDIQQQGFAFSETLAHANRLIRRGDAAWLPQDGLSRLAAKA